MSFLFINDSAAQARRFKNQNYSMPKDYQEDYDNLIAQGDVQLRDGSMPVWYQDRFLKITEFQRYLSGALVEVIFNIKHFLVAPNQKFNKAGSNTYTGQLQQITILELGPSDSPNPFSQRQGPLRINQQSPHKSQAVYEKIQPNQTSPPDKPQSTVSLPGHDGLSEPTPNSGPFKLFSSSDIAGPQEFVEGSSTGEKRKNISEVEDEINEGDEAEESDVTVGIGESRSVRKRRRGL